MMSKEIKRKILFILSPADKIDWEFMTHTAFLDRMGPYPPLGLLSLANSVKSKIKNSEIKILDGQIFSVDEIIGQVGRDCPDFVGISTSSVNYSSTLEIARFAKSLGSQVVFGGPHASALAKEILINRGPSSEDYCVDAVIRQDGEKAVSDFVLGQNPAKIYNLVWQTNSGKIVENEIKNLNINDMPLINRDFVDVETYFQKQQEAGRGNKFKRGLSMISQKGCAWRCQTGGCIFCSRMNKRISTKTPKKFWEEVLYLIERYRADIIWDVKDDFLENEKWLENLLISRPSLNKLRNLRIQSYARIDKITDRTVGILEKLKVPFSLIIGLESGSDSMLKTMNKGFSVQDAMRGISALKKIHVGIAASFVLGAPGENQESLVDTLKFAQKLKKMGIRIYPHLLEPLPYSRAFELLKRKNKAKYGDQDLFNIQEAIKDWVAGFCQAGLEEIFETYELLERLN